MEKITKQGLALTAYSRWKEQYKDNTNPKHKVKEHALGCIPLSEITPEKVDEVIGNSSWTKLQCEECGRESNEVMRLHNEYGKSFHICSRCLKRANQEMGIL